MKPKVAALDSRVWLDIGSLVVSLVGLAPFWGRFDVKTLHAHAERLPAARATVIILQGNRRADLSPQRIGWLAASWAIITGVSAWVLHSLRRSLRLA